MQIEKIDFNDERYPKLLRTIKKPPKQLYLLGNADLLNKNSIAIIGSRKCSDVGAKIAKKFSTELSNVGICIISGMAKGIDTMAHIGAIKNIGKTIAVLGCGLNRIYPKENARLFYDIIDKGGAVISEYEPDEDIESRKFIQRNRIVSGIARGVLVVEAAVRSGTGITAQFAFQEKRPVFCIPHNIDEKLGKGTNKLMQKGAKCVVNAQNILDEFNELKDLKIVDTNERESVLKEIPSKYEELYKIIKKSPCSADIICKKTNKSIIEINCELTMMELEGFIKRIPGNSFAIT